MELNIYRLTVTSNLYKADYIIRAVDIKEASKKAKMKFAKQYNVVGKEVKVSLNTNDIKNHIEEILDNLYNN